MKTKKFKKSIIIYIILILLLIIAGVIFFLYQKNYNEQVERLSTNYVNLSIENNPTEPPLLVQESFPTLEDFLNDCGDYDKYAPYLKENFPNFGDLLAQNHDVVGYISIPDTNISYPVMQNKDDAYYLKHNFDGTKGYPGCIYMEDINNKDFKDNVTVLYGHNMKNGTMFRQLHEFEDKDFFNNNRYVIIYTNDEISIYKIFLVSTYATDHLLNNCFTTFSDGSYSFNPQEENQNDIVVESVVSYNAPNLIYDDAAYDNTKQLLAMSTCGKGGKRLVVLASKLDYTNQEQVQ